MKRIALLLMCSVLIVAVAAETVGAHTKMSVHATRQHAAHSIPLSAVFQLTSGRFPSCSTISCLNRRLNKLTNDLKTLRSCMKLTDVTQYNDYAAGDLSGDTISGLDFTSSGDSADMVTVEWACPGTP